MTVNYVVGTPRNDKRMRISLILNIGKTKKRIHTDILVTRADLNRQGKLLKDSPCYKKVYDAMWKVEKEYLSLETNLTGETPTAQGAFRKIQKKQVPTFSMFAEEWLARCDLKGKKNYKAVINKFKEYTKYDISLEDFSYQTFDGFYQYIKDIKTFAQYLNALKVIYQDAEKRYDIPPYYSFGYKIPKQPKPQHRAVSKELLIQILSYDGKGKRAILARDCCMLSFCFAAMNSADLYNAPPIKGDILAYERTKTRDRRHDRAYIELNIHDHIRELVREYRGRSHAFNFYQRFSTLEVFNHSINIGLKAIKRELEERLKTTLPQLTFYTIRHTYATIARNDLGIEKSLVHELLLHIEKDTAIDDIYIKKDFRLINEANRKVIDYVFSTHS